MGTGNYVATVRDNRTGEIRQVEKFVKPSIGAVTSGNTGNANSGAGGGRQWTGTIINVQKNGK
jgi:hypothetical protein